jgi:integrase
LGKTASLCPSYADERRQMFCPAADVPRAQLASATTPDGIYELVRAYSAALGFEIGAHSLRATAATNALDHEADIAKVQEWLGHANIATTGKPASRGAETAPSARSTMPLRRDARLSPVAL